MKVQKFILFQLILFCVLFSGYIPVISNLPIAPEIPTASAATICPKFRGGNPAASDVAINPDKIREERNIPRACERGGLIAKVLCKIAEFFANLSGPGKLKLKDSQMPGYLRAANELALSGDLEEREEPGGITGGIAKMLIPGYKQNGRDPIKELTESEGRLVKGKIFLNNSALQKKFNTEVYRRDDVTSGEGYYDLKIGTDEEASSNYQVEGRFGEISPLYDRFGLLKQGLMPSAETIEIPDKNCIDYDPSVIAVTEFEGANPNRDVPWTAYKPIPGEDQEGKIVPCPKDEEGNVISCPTESGSETYGAGGNLDVQTKVSLASEAWERIGAPSNSPGEGGVFNVLLPPDTSFRTDQAEPQLKFDYDPHSMGNYSGGSTLYIADLGNVEGATSCIVDQLTAHPANAAHGVCEAAFEYFAGIPIECTDEATPLDFANTASSSIARRGWEIVNNLYQGFWCYWNWSKDDYPNIFDEALFQTNPNPSRSEVENDSQSLFWCTWLVWKTHSNHGPSLNSDGMAKAYGAVGGKAPYNSGGRFVSKEDATWKNVEPGYVVFFQTHGGPSRLNHVGIVYEVTRSYIKIVHSNAATKFDTITIGASGVQDLPWAVVGGFGKP
jgi:hypothetical protein